MIEIAAIRAVLEAHVASDDMECSHVERCRVLLEGSHQAGRDPTRRDAFTPGHFTASAFLVDEGLTRVLLIHHRVLRRWLQPGGHLELSDASPLAAARRELEEETTARAAVALLDGALLDVDVHSIPARGEVPAHEHFDLRFLFATNVREIAASDDVLDARWFDLQELDPMTADASIVRAAARIARIRDGRGAS